MGFAVFALEVDDILCLMSDVFCSYLVFLDFLQLFSSVELVRGTCFLVRIMNDWTNEFGVQRTAGSKRVLQVKSVWGDD